MKHGYSDIAIIGMDCIFPGAPDAETFWTNILAGVDATGDPPESWNGSLFYDPAAPAGTNDRAYCKRGGFIDRYARFDPLEFGITPGSIDGSDPDHYLALRVAARALADSGYAVREFDRSRVSVILGYGKLVTTGIMNTLYHGPVVEEILKALETFRPDLRPGDLAEIKKEIKAQLLPATAETIPGLTGNIVSGRIANRLDLQGPSFTLDAACASSLAALDVAVAQLSLHRIDMAIVGGVQGNLLPGMFISFSLLGALSRRGRLRPFDAAADGTLLAEGIGMMVIKRLEDARRDNDRIYAVVRGIGSSSDGKGQTLLTPRLEGETLALSRAYESCGLSPESVGLIEAHGTATTVGDATEISALSRVFGARKNGGPTCALGSVKSMIGHPLLSAGMAGLIKAARALYEKITPPTLFDTINPKLGLETTPFFCSREPSPWINGGASPRRAGVSSFGFGGVNYHIVLEEARSDSPAGVRRIGTKESAAEPCVLSAPTREKLITKCEALSSALQREGGAPSVGDTAFTLAGAARDGGPWRLACVAADNEQLQSAFSLALKKLRGSSCGSFSDRSGVFMESEPLLPHGKTAFLFPGEGSQYRGMLRETCMTYPRVRASFDAMDKAFIKEKRFPVPGRVAFPPPGPGGSLSPDDGPIWPNECAAALVMAADQGLGFLALDLGIKPDAVAGHSTGQDYALWFAGASSVDGVPRDTVPIDGYLRFDFSRASGDVHFLTVGGIDSSSVFEYIAGRKDSLFLAMDNCPNQVIIAGDKTAVGRASNDFTSLGALCSTVPIRFPYHTPLLLPYCAGAEPSNVYKLQTPGIPVYSCTTTAPLPGDADAIKKHSLDQWISPVRFREMIERMYDDGFRVFVETGARGNLSGFVDDILGEKPHLAIPFDQSGTPGPLVIARALARLFVQGAAVDLLRLHEGLGRRRVAIGGIADGEPESSGRGVAPRRMEKRLKMGFPKITIAPRGKQISPAGKSESRAPAPAGIRRAVWSAPARLLHPLGCGAAMCGAEKEIALASLASLILGPRERERFRAVPASLSREWLLGRLSAKDAIGQLEGSRRPVPEIEILEEPAGRLYAVSGNNSNGKVPVALSIAHAANVSVAVAVPRLGGLHGVGIDIAPADRDASIRDGFTPGERALLETIDPERRREWTLRFRCAKAAIAKAAGAAQAGGGFEIILRDPSGGTVLATSDETNASPSVFPMRTHTGVEGNLIYAVAAAMEQGGNREPQSGRA